MGLIEAARLPQAIFFLFFLNKRIYSESDVSHAIPHHQWLAIQSQFYHMMSLPVRRSLLYVELHCGTSSWQQRVQLYLPGDKVTHPAWDLAGSGAGAYSS